MLLQLPDKGPFFVEVLHIIMYNLEALEIVPKKLKINQSVMISGSLLKDFWEPRRLQVIPYLSPSTFCS